MTTSYSINSARRPEMAAIWEHLYAVAIPQRFLIDIESAKARGVPTTGDEDVDNVMLNQMTRTYKTINELFELWRLGADIEVINYDDTKKMYDAIQAHLRAWLSYLTKGVYLSTCPFEDLLELDQFASVVYDKSKYVFTREVVVGITGAWNNLGIDLNPNTFFAAKGRHRFQHLLLSDEEKQLERQEFGSVVIPDREGFEEAISSIASRHDVRMATAAKDAIRFGNNKQW